MRFIINSQLFLKHLSALSGVISNNNTVPIISCFHLHLEDNMLTIKATDLETTMVSRIELENARVDGIDSIAVPAKLLLDMLKSLDDVPLNFAVDASNYSIEISSGEGKYSLAGQNAETFPAMPEMKETVQTSMPASVLVNAINKTAFAASTDEMRQQMSGIFCELTPEKLREYMKAGKFHSLPGAPEFSEEDLPKLHRCVTVLGAEPFVEAIRQGAQVVIAGRTTDTSIYTALPMLYDMDNGYAWHAAKILECGSLASVKDKHHGAMFAWVRPDSASIEPGHPENVVSPNSIVSHLLYENDNPYVLTEPGHRIFTKDSRYEAESERRVRITNTGIEKTPYTVKLEGVKFEGYRRVAIGGVSDPLIFKQFDSFVANVEKYAKMLIERNLGLKPSEYRLRIVRYGNPEDENTNRVALLYDIVAKTPEDADAMIATVWHTALHVPIPDYIGAQSQMAYPFSPPSLQTLCNGETYSFCLNHVIDVEDPLETARISYETL